jgi:hypothetical protein
MTEPHVEPEEIRCVICNEVIGRANGIWVHVPKSGRNQPYKNPDAVGLKPYRHWAKPTGGLPHRGVY